MRTWVLSTLQTRHQRPRYFFVISVIGHPRLRSVVYFIECCISILKLTTPRLMSVQGYPIDPLLHPSVLLPGRMFTSLEPDEQGADEKTKQRRSRSTTPRLSKSLRARLKS